MELNHHHPVNTMKINLIIADDHPALIAGIKYELSSIHTLEVVGTASNSTEIVELLAKEHCDILITDYVMPGGEYGDGMTMLSFLRRRYPNLRIIVFTTIDSQIMLTELIKLGVHSVLNKVEHISHLIFAIHAVHAGATYFSPKHYPSSSTSRHAQPHTTRRLSRREAEVIRLYVSGLSINEIASQFNRSKQTISSQKTSAMRKLGIKRDVELIRFAHEMGLVITTRPDDCFEAKID
jgi:two-component system capsular synthesis response regulator RcsB